MKIITLLLSLGSINKMYQHTCFQVKVARLHAPVTPEFLGHHEQ